MKKVMAMMVVAVLAVPVGAQARPHSPGTGVAAKACKAEREANPSDFAAKYANEKGKRALRRCVRTQVRAARKACRAERKSDRAAFKVNYANEKGKRALARCVRDHADEAL